MTDYKLVPVKLLKDWHKRINTIAVETAFDVADEMKELLAYAAPDVQGEPVYFWREIGETDWMECRKDWYWKCANSPEHDTKLLYTAPQPAETEEKSRD